MSNVTAVLHHSSTPTSLFVSTPLGLEHYDIVIGRYVGTIGWPLAALNATLYPPCRHNWMDTLYSTCHCRRFDECGPYNHSQLYAYDAQSMVVATDGNNMTAWDARQPKVAMSHQLGTHRALGGQQQLAFDGHTIIAAQRIGNHIALHLNDLRNLRAGPMATFTLGSEPLSQYAQWRYCYDASTNMVVLGADRELYVYSNIFEHGHMPEGVAFPQAYGWGKEVSTYNNTIMVGHPFSASLFQRSK